MVEFLNAKATFYDVIDSLQTGYIMRFYKHLEMRHGNKYYSRKQKQNCVHNNCSRTGFWGRLHLIVTEIEK